MIKKNKYIIFLIEYLLIFKIKNNINISDNS